MSWTAPASYSTSSQITAEAYNADGVKVNCGGAITITTTPAPPPAVPEGNLKVHIWDDSKSENCNQNADESDMGGINVSATPSGGGSSVSGVTNSSGDVTFSDLAVGDYLVTVTPKTGYISSSGCSASVVTIENGKTVSYNWALVKPEKPAWFNTFDGDIHTNSYLYSAVPSNKYLISASWDNSGGVCSAKLSIDLGLGSVGDKNNWGVSDYNRIIDFPPIALEGSYSSFDRWNNLSAGEIYEFSDNEITSTVTYKVSGTGFAVIKVEGDLDINNDIKSDDLDKTGLLIFVDGGVTIGENAQRVDAIILAAGEIAIEGKGGKNDKVLVVNGSLYGNKVTFGRNRYKADENAAASETVKFMPIYSVGTIPQDFKQMKIYWISGGLE